MKPIIRFHQGRSKILWYLQRILINSIYFKLGNTLITKVGSVAAKFLMELLDICHAALCFLKFSYTACYSFWYYTQVIREVMASI